MPSLGFSDAVHVESTVVSPYLIKAAPFACAATLPTSTVSILPAISIIGCTTFCLSLVGVAVGNFFGTRYKKRAELSGGIILILLGAKILLEHLGILG